MSRSKAAKNASRAKIAHKTARETRQRKPAREPYQVLKATPLEIAEAIVFERGLGAGSAAEFENIKEAAERAYAEGIAEGLAQAGVVAAPVEAR